MWFNKRDTTVPHDPDDDEFDTVADGEGDTWCNIAAAFEASIYKVRGSELK